MSAQFHYRDSDLVTCSLYLLGCYAEVWIWGPADGKRELEFSLTADVY